MMGNVDTTVNTKLEDGIVTLEIDGLETVAQALGDLSKKAPAALKVAVNQTAREARKMMIAAVKARYAVNAAGQRHINELKTKKKATNTDPSATLFISTMRDDLGYFDNSPRAVYTGAAASARKGTLYSARVLKESKLEPLPGKGTLGKGFLAQFKSGHIGMVQRVIGSNSERTRTENGYPRWRNKQGQVEKLRTMNAISATAMHKKIWPDVQDDIELYLMARLQDRVEWILARAGAKR